MEYNTDDKIEIPKGIHGGSTIQSDEIIFRVSDISAPANEDPFSAVGMIEHRAIVSRIERPLPSISSHSTPFDICFPVQMLPVQYCNTVSPDQKAPVEVIICNISNQDLGIHSKSKRKVFIQIRCTGGDSYLSRDSFDIGNEKGEILSENEVIHDIEHIESDSSHVLQLMVKSNQNTPVNSFAAITVSLYLAQADDYTSYRAIQQRNIQIQFSEEYKPGKHSLLLVTNNRTDTQELIAWKTLLQSITGTQPAIFNISLYGGLRMFETRSSDGKSIIDDLASGTLVFLNNNCSSISNPKEDIVPYEELSDVRPLELITKFAIRVYIVGNCNALRQYLVPKLSESEWKTEALHFDSVESFLNIGVEETAYSLVNAQKKEKVFYTATDTSNIGHNEAVKGRLKAGMLKAAQVDCDLAAFFDKRRRDNDKLRKISPWQKRFIVLRQTDKTLSWYGSATEKAPRGIIDLNVPFSLDISGPVSFLL